MPTASAPHHEDAYRTVGIESYCTNLRVLCDLVERELSDSDATAAKPELDLARGLLAEDPPGASAPNHHARWRRIDEAELRLVALMPEPFLHAEMPARFARAEKLGVTGIADLKAAYEVVGATFEAKRRVAVALLQRMYDRYAERRMDRSERKVVDERMLDFAFWVFAGLVVLTLALGVAGDRLSATCVGEGGTPPGPIEVPCDFPYLWLMVWYFGVVGAFFSRFLEYRRQRIDLSWEDLTAGYSVGVTLGRLMIGGIGALLFYFLMRGDLLAGQLFLSDDGLGVWNDAGGLVAAEGFFRLFVWSAIAGFSERLVPERFDELSASSTKAGGTK